MMRKLLTAATVLAALVLGGCNDNKDSVKPKNLIFFLGDGYGIVPMTATRIYTVGESGQLQIDQFPESAFIKTYSNDAQVTDSAPSMSAYMTGYKMNNEVISMSTDTKAADSSGKGYVSGADSTCPASGNGTPVTTLLELAKAAGRGTAVVTTTRVTHATPAATYAHICHRDGENNIAAQLVPGGSGFNSALLDGVDVVLGGGWQHFLPQGDTKGSSRSDTRNLVDEMKAKGYSYVSNVTDLQAVPASTTGKLLGLFTKGHMNFDLDRDPASEPSLSQMTAKAIDIVSKNPKGFFLMVEGGRIDQALHPTLARKALQDGKAFDEAIKTAIDKMKTLDPELKNTLIVVTADHDHTLVMNGYAALTGATTDTHPGILGLMRDYTAAQNTDGSQKDLSTVTPSKDADGKPFTTLVFGNGENRIQGNRNTQSDLSDDQVFNKDYHQEAAIRMPSGSETHGGGDVFLGAMGLNADTFHGTLENNKVFDLCKAAVGL
ncbi:alkaline phosphatase [Solimonas aquatica]|uniref:Alkaline phosphatase n=1 Tax=Solimonas aquatica TaxID=489703 RepID=A0A1H9CH16_9GAMM|nr:alkaline phosphatase [Solimonas aquatica]SEQ00530.1 alkaline phosphatase [Solimonas aquatica]